MDCYLIKEKESQENEDNPFQLTSLHHSMLNHDGTANVLNYF